MKLDKHINPDGRGKYALINLRTNQVQWGGADQFFVLKYKDKFAPAALDAYADAIALEVKILQDHFNTLTKPNEAKMLLAKRIDSLVEYAGEIRNEARAARAWPVRRIPD